MQGNFRERIGKLTVGEAITLNAASNIIRKHQEEQDRLCSADAFKALSSRIDVLEKLEENNRSRWDTQASINKKILGLCLDEFVDEKEEYEEPKEFYIVEHRGKVGSRFRTGDIYEGMFKEIGNYFETKEEAEKAVEKLKAFKRLEDKGLIFCGTYSRKGENIINFEFGDRPLNQTEADEAEKDLDTIFGGEE